MNPMNPDAKVSTTLPPFMETTTPTNELPTTTPTIIPKIAKIANDLMLFKGYDNESLIISPIYIIKKIKFTHRLNSKFLKGLK